jgi:hypothetical protein
VTLNGICNEIRFAINFRIFLSNKTFIDCFFEVTAFWSYHSLSADPCVSGDLMFVPFVIMIPVVAV